MKYLLARVEEIQSTHVHVGELHRQLLLNHRPWRHSSAIKRKKSNKHRRATRILLRKYLCTFILLSANDGKIFDVIKR